MQCQFCGKRLPFLRKLTSAEFCSDEHRDQFAREQRQAALARLSAPRHSPSPEAAAAPMTPTRTPPAGRPPAVQPGVPPAALDLLGPFLVPVPAKTSSLRRPPVIPIRRRLWVTTPRLDWRPCRGHAPGVAPPLLTARALPLQGGPEATGNEAGLSVSPAVPGSGLRPVPASADAPGPTAEPRPAIRKRTVPNPPSRVADPVVPDGSQAGGPPPPAPPSASAVPSPVLSHLPAELAPAVPIVPGPAARRGLDQAYPRGADTRWTFGRSGWRPRLLPAASLAVVRDDRAASVGPGPQQKGLKGLPEPRAASPRPAVITPPVVADVFPVLPTPEVAMPLPIEPRGAAMARADKDIWTVATLAVGHRLMIPIRPHSIDARPRCVAPKIRAKRWRHGVGLAEQILTAVPLAEAGADVIWITSEHLLPDNLMRRAFRLRLRKAEFDPPRCELLPVRVRSAPVPAAIFAPDSLREEAGGPPVARGSSGTRPTLDWLPVMAPPANLDLQVNPVAMPARVVASVEPEPPRPTFVKTRPNAVLTPVGLVRGPRTSRLRALPFDEQSVRRAATPPRADLTPERIVPSPTTGRLSMRLGKPWPRRLEEYLKAPAWKKVLLRGRDSWRRLPAGPKVITVMMALLMAVASVVPSSSLPALPLAAAGPENTAGPDQSAGQETDGAAGPLGGVRAWLSRRAAISLTDDFRQGLSDWEGAEGWARSWAYDAAGFVRTGQLAVLTPSMGLVNYRMEFVAQIERRSLGWVVRARDLRNYQAIKLTFSGEPGRRPLVTLTRYPVVGGAPGRMVTKSLALAATPDSIYRVTTDVQGEDFAVTVQGQVADSWSEPRLDTGGVGFFSSAGERARLSWVGVWHQYDAIGKLCALLAPAELSGRMD